MLEVKKLLITLGFLMSAIDAVTSEELLELTCLEASQCKQFHHSGVNVKCIDDHCKCSTVAGEHVKCKPKDYKVNNIIGGPCPCTQPNAVCNKEQDICYCSVKFIPSIDRRRCLQKIIHLNDDCELDLQCQQSNAFAACDPKERKCICKEGFIAINGSCSSLVGLNSTCRNDTQCQAYGQNAQCAMEQLKCICAEGFTTATNKINCLPNVNYHQNCTEHEQCKNALGTGGICHKGECDCDENGKYIAIQKESEDDNETNANAPMETVCAASVELGKYCRTSNDCYQHQLPELEQTMDCHYGECICKWGYNSINNGECKKGSHGGKIKGIGIWATVLMAAGGMTIGW